MFRWYSGDGKSSSDLRIRKIGYGKTSNSIFLFNMAWFAKGRIKGYVWISGWIFKIQFLLSSCRQCTPLSKYNGNLCLECILQRSSFPSRTRFFTEGGGRVKGNIIESKKTNRLLSASNIIRQINKKSINPIMISNNNYNNFFKCASIVAEFHRNLQFFVTLPPFSHSSNLPKFPKWNPSNFNRNVTTPLEQQIRRNRLRRAEQKRYREKTSNVEPQGWIN